MICHKVLICCEKWMGWYIDQELGCWGVILLIGVQFGKCKDTWQFECKVRVFNG
jgi:hypothetical protein